MKRAYEFAREWLLLPFLPLIITWVQPHLASTGLGEWLASRMQPNPPPELIKTFNQGIAQGFMAIALLLLKVLANYFSGRYGMDISTKFQRPREGDLSGSAYIGRVEDTAAPLVLLIKTKCLKPRAVATLNRFLPDLEVHVSWKSAFLIVTAESQGASVAPAGSDRSVLKVPISGIIDQGSSSQVVYFTVYPVDNDRTEGHLSVDLWSSHRVYLWVLRRWVLQLNTPAIQLRLKEPAQSAMRQAAGGV